ncbi:MAG: rRNA maturation RNase YbeY [Polyangiaceae bacterium]|nr:rRNA maturation RNase YbeY [Polyangiaceae bacterium]
MLDTLGLTNVELSLALVGDETIADLNQRFRKKAKATDVLSFPLHSVDAGSIVAAAQAGPVVHLGDVIISVPTATRQAKERSRAVLDEMTTLVAHGLLHLLGFDHRNDAEEREMEAFARVLEAAALAKKPLWFRLVPND